MKPRYENAHVAPLIGGFAELLADPNRDANKGLLMLQEHAAGVLAVLLETKTATELRALLTKASEP